MESIDATIKIKRGHSSSMESLFLHEGEPAVEMDTGNLYIGTDPGGGLGKKLIGRTLDKYASLPFLMTQAEADEAISQGKVGDNQIMFVEDE